ncbi:regulator of sigma E protease [Flavobacteriaceae bacterium MAR_2010_188]|nr:regulator of sigma E protease [Flavobacteriaceae bacterium MAR_2010_188]
MEFVIKISQFLLSLSLLIVLHEMGHFIPARLFKTRVEKFFLFFDLKYALFRKKIGDTVYGIGWLPLGGYVKIAGMIDESMDKEQMEKPPQPWEFRSKPAWQRLIIMLGGVTVNFILAYVIYVFISFAYGDSDIKVDSLKGGYSIENPTLNEIGFRTGDKIISINDNKIVNDSDIRKYLIDANEITVERDGEMKSIELPEDFLGQLSSGKVRGLFDLRIPFLVAEVADTSANKDAGLLKGDMITSVNGKQIDFYDQLAPTLKELKNQEVPATVLRDDETVSLNLKVDNTGRIGVFAGIDPDRFEKMGYYESIQKDYTLAQSFGAGYDKFTETVGSYWGQLAAIVNPSTGAYKGVGGFKAIFDIFPATWSWQAFWALTAFLSIMLAVLNLLPIPALDGGHVMFLLYEMVSGRKPSEAFLEKAQLVGFVLLIMLVLFANGNDIFKAFTN